MKVSLRCDVSEASEAHRALGTWIDEVERGDLDADELVHQINGVIEKLELARSNVRRALGW